MLEETTCKRCGKRLMTLTEPIFCSEATMEKWKGICAGCVTEKEKAEMMLEFNADIKNRIETQR